MAPFKKSPEPPKSLRERIEEYCDRAEKVEREGDALVDEAAEELKEQSPGVPVGVLRNILMGRSGGTYWRALRSYLEQM